MCYRNLLFLFSANLTPNSALHILYEMATLTVDLQDLCCQVGPGQRLVLHTTGVSNTIILSVHLELQGAADCEWFSRWVHVCNACKEPRSQRESKQGSNVLVKWLLTMRNTFFPSHFVLFLISIYKKCKSVLRPCSLNEISQIIDPDRNQFQKYIFWIKSMSNNSGRLIKMPINLHSLFILLFFSETSGILRVKITVGGFFPQQISAWNLAVNLKHRLFVQLLQIIWQRMTVTL